MKKIEIIIGISKRDDIILIFQVYENSIANKWYSLLSETIKDQYEIEEASFRNLGLDSIESLCEKINDSIDFINKEKPGSIPHRIEINKQPVKQETLNILHTYFSDCHGRGSDVKWETDEMRKALSNLNRSIHMIENIQDGGKPKIVINLKPFNRLPLSDEDYDYFSLKRSFGEIQLRYSEIGKRFLDLFFENDEINDIMPTKCYTADMVIFLGDSDQTIYWDEIQTWLIKKGLDPADKKLALGAINVAKLQSPDRDLVEKLRHNPKIKSIRILDK